MRTLFFCLGLSLLLAGSSFSQKLGKDYQISVNNIALPLNDKGILAGVNVIGIGPGGKFDSNTFLKTSGFFLSGYSSGTLWANGVASTTSNDIVAVELPLTLAAVTEKASPSLIAKASPEMRQVPASVDNATSKPSGSESVIH